MSFGGKSAVVTGGAAGIGLAAAEMLARGGASIIIADRRRADANRVKLRLIHSPTPGR